MRAWVLVLLAAAAACGDTAPPPGVPIDQACEGEPRIPSDLSSCDITDCGCQLGIFQSVAELLEQDASLVPEIRTISVSQFADEVRSGVSEDDLVGDDPVSRGLRLIGFIPSTAQSATDAAIELRIASVAAYYSSRSGSITIIDRDYDAPTAQEILAHEFVHAFQDRQYGIGVVFRGADTTDALMGRRLVIEGDATYLAAEWILDQLGVAFTLGDWEDEYARLQGFAIADAGDLERAIDESASFFPYAYGLELLGRATQAGGLPERGELFTTPPDTARDGMAGYDGFDANGFLSVDAPNAPLSDPVAGSALASDDRSGAWYVYATLLRGGLSSEDAWSRALDWRGDRLGIFEAGSEVVVVWRLRFAEDASFVADAIAQTPRDVLWSTVVDSNEAYVIAAESEEALATWEAQPASLVAELVDSAPNVPKSVQIPLPDGCRAPRERQP